METAIREKTSLLRLNRHPITDDLGHFVRIFGGAPRDRKKDRGPEHGHRQPNGGASQIIGGNGCHVVQRVFFYGESCCAA
jgi:hypothetical protein